MSASTIAALPDDVARHILRFVLRLDVAPTPLVLIYFGLRASRWWFAGPRQPRFAAVDVGVLARAVARSAAVEELLFTKGNGLGAPGARALAGALAANRSLRDLWLHGNAIGAEGARALAIALTVNTTLDTLRLSDNSIGAEGARALADALRVNDTLHSLRIGYNGIGTEGAKAIAAALETNTTLRVLALNENGIGSDGVAALARALTATAAGRDISLSGNRIEWAWAEALLAPVRGVTVRFGQEVQAVGVAKDPDPAPRRPGVTCVASITVRPLQSLPPLD